MLPRLTAQTPLPPTRSVAGCSQSELSVHTGTCSPCPLAPCGHRSWPGPSQPDPRRGRTPHGWWGATEGSAGAAVAGAGSPRSRVTGFGSWWPSWGNGFYSLRLVTINQSSAGLINLEVRLIPEAHLILITLEFRARRFAGAA